MGEGKAESEEGRRELSLKTETVGLLGSVQLRLVQWNTEWVELTVPPSVQMGSTFFKSPPFKRYK